jgi:hypothetical protein
MILAVKVGSLVAFIISLSFFLYSILLIRKGLHSKRFAISVSALFVSVCLLLYTFVVLGRGLAWYIHVIIFLMITSGAWRTFHDLYKKREKP